MGHEAGVVAQTIIKNISKNVIFRELAHIHIYVGKGNGDPLQYSFLENPTDGGTWRAAVHGGRKELDMTE